MRLTMASETVFVAESGYEERALPKAAGFLWHGGNCRPGCSACAAGLGKVWWTNRKVNASRLAEYADDTAKAALAEAVASVAASRAVDANLDVPAPAGLSYLPFQRAGIAYAMARPSTLFADEMGLGKTIQALGLINADASVRTVCVVCPKTLRLNWQREAEKWLTRPFKIHVVERPEAPPADATFVVVNYDKLRDKRVREALMAREWDVLVADEAHFVKNPKAQRTQALLGKAARGRGEARTEAVPGLASRARRSLYLTGTPILNKPIEVQPLLAALVPSEFGSFFGFAKRYCAAHQTRFGWDFSGAAHLDELQERMRASCMVRRLKRDVLTELPPKRRQIVELAPNGAAGLVEREARTYAAHEDAIEDARAAADLAHATHGEGSAEYKAAVDRLRDVAQVAFTEMSAVRHELALAKVDSVIEHVDGMLEGGVEKVVLFAHHRDVIEKFAEHWNTAAVTLTGETPDADRQSAVDRFQTDDTVRVFIGSTTAAGVGITLTASSNVVFAELDWVPANITQAEDRTHRIGQAESVLVQHLVFDGSLDARMAKVLVEKQEIADKALDRATTIEPVTAAPKGARRSARPSKYPVASDESRAAAKEAMRMLAGMCDGARQLDGAGFSKIDVTTGHSLAAFGGTYTDGQVWLASKLARKYRRQLPSNLVEVLGVAKKTDGVEVEE